MERRRTEAKKPRKWKAYLGCGVGDVWVCVCGVWVVIGKTESDAHLCMDRTCIHKKKDTGWLAGGGGGGHAPDGGVVDGAEMVAVDPKDHGGVNQVGAILFYA